MITLHEYVINMITNHMIIVELVAMDLNRNITTFNNSEQSEVPSSEPHWPYFACCQMVASYGSLLAILASPHNDQWRKKEAESGLELMDTALDNLASVWPIIAFFRSEIRSCRDLMNSVPHG